MITGIILAGGSSRRMGRDKAMMPVKGRPIIAHVTAVVEEVCDHIIILARPDQDFEFLGKQIVHDIIPGYGALMGIYTGLKTAPGDRVLVTACDMPFIKPAVLRHLVTFDPQADAVVPRINGYLEPLLAVYSKNCLAPIEKMIRRSQKCIYDFYPQVRMREVPQSEIEVLDPGLKSIININTPQEFTKIEA